MNKNLFDKITIEHLIAKYASLGYKIFSNDIRKYNLNIGGYRAKELNTDTFNDIIFAFWNYNGEWNLFKAGATTDPGSYYMQHSIGSDGCTHIMKAGQYRGAYQLGLHQNKYPALIQVKNIDFYCDCDADIFFDKDESRVKSMLIGANIHSTINQSYTMDTFAKKTFPNVDAPLVRNWSAACQVFANPSEYQKFIAMIYAAVNLYGNSFTYTLIDE